MTPDDWSQADNAEDAFIRRHMALLTCVASLGTFLGFAFIGTPLGEAVLLAILTAVVVFFGVARAAYWYLEYRNFRKPPGPPTGLA
jgi:hypothetical protein